MDIGTEPGRGGFMKELKFKKTQSWLALANLADAVVICANLGEVITPASNDARKSAECNSLPSKQDYLAAHLVCIDRLVSHAGKQTASLDSLSEVRLSYGIGWRVCGDPFKDCKHDSQSRNTCWNRQDIFQKCIEAIYGFFQDKPTVHSINRPINYD